MYSIDFLGNIIRDLDGATISYDMGNIHYQEYLDWIAEGNTPLPYEPPVVGPKEQAMADLMATDKEMARIAEDLINTLIAKGVIAAQDLPKPAMSKIFDRAALRKVLQADDD